VGTIRLLVPTHHCCRSMLPNAVRAEDRRRWNDVAADYGSYSSLLSQARFLWFLVNCVARIRPCNQYYVSPFASYWDGVNSLS
jgi:hypothetical protein